MINDDDYVKIERTVGSKYCGSFINIDFVNWSKSESIVNELDTNISKKLYTYNTNNIAAKVIWYKSYKDFNFQIMFLAIFIGILFFITTGGMLYFRQVNEFESLRVDTIS